MASLAGAQLNQSGYLAWRTNCILLKKTKQIQHLLEQFFAISFVGLSQA